MFIAEYGVHACVLAAGDMETEIPRLVPSIHDSFDLFLKPRFGLLTVLPEMNGAFQG